MANKTSKNKGKWSRDHHPRPKFITTSATVAEWELAHTIARSMGMDISKMLRQLLKDQYYRLAKHEYQPAPEQFIELGEVNQND